MQFNITLKQYLNNYIHKKFRFMRTNTFCKYRKKTTRIASRASCYALALVSEYLFPWVGKVSHDYESLYITKICIFP